MLIIYFGEKDEQPTPHYLNKMELPHTTESSAIATHGLLEFLTDSWPSTLVFRQRVQI